MTNVPGHSKTTLALMTTAKKCMVSNDLVPPEILCRASRGEEKAPSCKRQATRTPAGTAERAKLQAPSCKRQAPSEYK